MPLLILALLLLAGGSRAQPAPSLIVNGSFEEGPKVTQFLNLAKGDTSVAGWTVTGEGVDYVSTVSKRISDPRLI